MRNVGGISAAASTLGMLEWSRVAAAAGTPSDYKAMVCIFLFGGSDSFNTVIPSDPAGYATYALPRRDLAIPSANLLQLTDSLHVDPLGRSFGLNPAMASLQPIFQNDRKLAVTLNVGTLLDPMTKAQYLSGAVQPPPSIGSHADQQFQMQTAGIPTAMEGLTGWHGRIADLLAAANNGTSSFANISLAGHNTIQTGQQAMPFTVDASGNVSVLLSKYASGDMQSRLLKGVQGLLHTSPHVMAKTYGNTKERALSGNSALSQALTSSPAPAGFPTTGLGTQLQTVARIMAVAPALGITRQTFFLSMGGFDTHSDQNNIQPILLKQLADALAAFYNYTVLAGNANNVTTFTASDFARTFAMNANFGTDHAWGGIQFVMGGSVKGGFYGTMPDQTMGGPDDSGSQGRFIPTTAIDQVASTLALWFGVTPSSLSYVTPRIGHFTSSDLGFMTV